jgi:excisionase family DNA binding protein
VKGGDGDEGSQSGNGVDNMGDKDFLTPNEAARLLMVSPITIRQWAQKGILEAQTTAGGHRRFSRSVIEAFARERGIQVAGSRPCLLIVDDNRQLNDYLVALFSAEVPDLEIHAAYDGFDAGRQVTAHRPTVVLLDVMMPGIDGVEVCRRLKNDPETAGVRVVAMTGYHTPELERKTLTAGAQVLLRKPFSSQDVLRECGFGEPQKNSTARG